MGIRGALPEPVEHIFGGDWWWLFKSYSAISTLLTGAMVFHHIFPGSSWGLCSSLSLGTAHSAEGEESQASLWWWPSSLSITPTGSSERLAHCAAQPASREFISRLELGCVWPSAAPGAFPFLLPTLGSSLELDQFSTILARVTARCDGWTRSWGVAGCLVRNPRLCLWEGRVCFLEQA